MGGISDPSPLSQTLWGSVNSLSTAPGNLLPPSLSSVRTVLHFGSGRSGVASTASSGIKKSLKTSMQSTGSLTPVNPRSVSAVCMCVCVYICQSVCVCVHVLVYVHACTHTSCNIMR